MVENKFVHDTKPICLSTLDKNLKTFEFNLIIIF